METFKLEKMPDEWVCEIQTFIEAKREKFRRDFVNQLLREDLLLLLDKWCTVIYYPVNDEQNHGFHVRRHLADKEEDFVFINTNQDKEKQIFAAAHELGHIWRLDQFLKERGIALDEEQEEDVMNRFAAELMMPTDLFLKFIMRQVSSYPQEGTAVKIQIHDMLRICLAAMYEYFMPYKAVVIRLFELGFLTKDSAEKLLGKGALKYSAIEDFLKSAAKVEGYDSRLFRPDKRKWIKGLQELLEQAQKSGRIAAPRLNAIRQRFDLPVFKEASELSNNITVQTKETRNDVSGSCD